jgi:flagellar basal body rod protein FlgC
VQFSQVTIKAKSNQVVEMLARYGLAKDQLNVTSPAAPNVTEHEIELDSKLLVPGTTYFYQVVAKNQQGQIVATAVESFKTRGFTVAISLHDKNRQPLPNQSATLHSDPVTAKSNDKGVVTFNDVAPGKHMIEFTNAGKKYSQNIEVMNTVVTNSGIQTADTQNMSIVYDFIKQESLWPKIALSFVGTIFLAIIAWLIFKNHDKFRKDRLHNLPLGSGYSDTPVIVTSSNPSANSAFSDLSRGADETDKKIDLSRIPDVNRPNPGSTVTPSSSTEREGEHK